MFEIAILQGQSVLFRRLHMVLITVSYHWHSFTLGISQSWHRFVKLGVMALTFVIALQNKKENGSNISTTALS